MQKKPLQEIKEQATNVLPAHLLKVLPSKWEKIGDILIIKLPDELQEHAREIAQIYAEILNCQTVLEDTAGISGEFRQPSLKHLYGSKDAETVHIENSVKYKLDASKIMFSSGNMDERIRMATIAEENEVIVDLFAGIGYFSLPLAVHSNPQQIYACEKNPLAYKYLCQNIALNDVTEVVTPLDGDNRKVAPEGVADRVILGYLQDTHVFLSTAINSLKEEGGILHYHEACPDAFIPDRPLRYIRKAACEKNMDVDVLDTRKVKSYAPGVFHVVIDVKVMR